MQSLIKRTIACLVALLSWALAPDARAGDWAWLTIADSEADFGGKQGAFGWHYLFATSDTGPGTPMTVFDDPCSPSLQWNPAWRSQCGTYCFISAFATHTNQAVSCDTPSAGLQIPIRRYVPPSFGLYRVTVRFLDDPITFSNTDGVRVSLVIDGQTLWEAESNGSLGFEAEGFVEVILSPAISADVRSHPKAGCHHDTHSVFVTIEALDCNGDGVADYQQIADSTVADANGNGVPDTCECIADLNADATVNGADIAVVLGFWGLSGNDVLGDINRDGTINGADLAILLSSWGDCP